MKPKPTSIWLDPGVLSSIKEAAEKLGVPFTIFIRMAAKKEADRVLRTGSKRKAA